MAEPVGSGNFAAYLTIGNVQVPGSFDTHSGGALTVESESYRPGGMTGTIVVNGPPQREAITLERYYDAKRDLPLIPWMESRVHEPVSVSLTYMGPDKRPLGPPRVRTGKISSITEPDLDSNSTDIPKLAIEVNLEMPS